jgi:putative transposase
MGHTYSDILLHIVFGTWRRRPDIEERFRARLYEYMAGVARNEFGKALILGGTADHVHTLVSLRPDVSVSEAMRKWKCLSSGWVRKTFPDCRGFQWQDGYGCFSVSRSNREKVYRYIERQEAHHRKLSFDEELRLLLERHGLAGVPHKGPG